MQGFGSRSRRFTEDPTTGSLSDSEFQLDSSLVPTNSQRVATRRHLSFSSSNLPYDHRHWQDLGRPHQYESLNRTHSVAERRIYQNDTHVILGPSEITQPADPEITRTVNPPPGLTGSFYTPWNGRTAGKKITPPEGVQITREATTSLTYHSPALEGNYGRSSEFVALGNNPLLSRSLLLHDEDSSWDPHYKLNRTANNTTFTLLPSLPSYSVDNTLQNFALERGDPIQPSPTSDFEKMTSGLNSTFQPLSDSPNKRMFDVSACESSTPTRFLKVSCVPRDMSIWVARDAFKCYGDLKGIFTAFLGSDGVIFLEFFDIRHAIAAARKLHSNETFKATTIKVYFCSRSTLSQVSHDILEYGNEGLLSVSVHCPRLSDNELLRLLSSYGEVRSFQIEGGDWPPQALVEYHDIRKAASAKATLEDLHRQKKIRCNVSFYQQDRATHLKVPFPQVELSACSSNTTPLLNDILNGDNTPALPMYLHQTNVQIQHNIPADANSSSHGKSQTTMFLTTHQEASCTQKSYLSQDSAEAIPSNNKANNVWSASSPDKDKQIDPKQTRSPAIEESKAETSEVHISEKDDKMAPSQEVVDKRTTYMIRNIPNKYTQEMLLECINETHFGKFDFLYLRMDFKNKCNVGYAFINFINTDVIGSFIESHVGKKWSRFNSDKICSLSYANIQGRQALVEKFRNSSVMEEDPSYRPKIFFTSGPNVGLEEPFPKRNVQCKEASHESARRRMSAHRNSPA
ncbi:hypothetical protein EMPS_08081 [Entomortierella parvispora]|uniref:RRM domain-containing protein n=1 Tax=Entomortierella parvispora TaxID=205924 RepID=A0A9P3HG16_9FUNG|nr:hypothetical protein EMPS_08081 [Entomortierella parvispora]